MEKMMTLHCRNRFRHWSCALALLVLATRANFVMAEGHDDTGIPAESDTPDAADLAQEGVELYRSGTYRLAIERFAAAYELKPDPNLLFNRARCHQALGEHADAIAYYEKYLASEAPNSRGAQRARQALSELRPSEQSHSSQTPANTSEPQFARPLGPQARPAEPEGRGVLSWLPYVLLGGGIIAAGTGATYYILGVEDHQTVMDAEGYGNSRAAYALREDEARQLVADGDRSKAVGMVAMTVGGALLVTSISLLIINRQDHENATTDDATVSLTVDATASRAGLGVRGGF